jgi:hypothetical protein
MKKKTIYLSNTVDFETGEVKGTSWTKREEITMDQFARAYIHDIKLLAKCRGAEMAVVLCCLEYLEYNTNEIILSTARRIDISKEAELTQGTFNVTFSQLVKKNIFIKIDKKLYLNPILFFYGTDVERQRCLEATIDYPLNTKL